MEESTSNEQQALEQLSDAELVRIYQEHGKQEGLGVLYSRYRHLVFSMSYRYVKNREDAADMVNYIFTLLLEKLPGKDIRSFKQYLYGTIRNECLARNRQQKKEMQRQNEWAQVKISHERFMENEALQHLTNETSAEDLVQQAIEHLGEEQKTCVIKFFYEGLSYKEISENTGFTLKKVKSYLQNGKRNLKIYLEEKLEKPSS